MSDETFKALVDKLSDREWRIDNLYYIKDKQGNVVKFVRNDSQREFWQEMWYQNLLLKDRQRGFSTLIELLILDTCFFNSNTDAGIIDITLSDAKKKLDKIRFAYEQLPVQLRLANPLTEDNKETLKFANGSSVSVGTSHRGGTLQILHVSEMGKIASRFPDRAREIRTGALNTVAQGCLVFIESTAEGNSGEFYEDCMAALSASRNGSKLTPIDYKFHFFGWWMGDENEMDPECVALPNDLEKYFAELEQELGIKLSDRKKAWYVRKDAQQKGDMKREYPGTPEEAFEAAIEGVYLAEIITSMEKREQIGIVPMQRGIPVNTGWDFGINDHMTIWLHQRVSEQDRLVGYLEGSDYDVVWYWIELQRRYPVLWGNHFLPHDGNTRRIGTSTDPASPPRTIQQILSDAGMRNTFIVPRISDKWVAIQEVKLWLPSAMMDRKECADGLKCLKNFRREWDDKNGCWKNLPRHDWAMHGYDGLETLVRGLNAYGVAASSTQQVSRPGLRTHRRMELAA